MNNFLCLTLILCVLGSYGAAVRRSERSIYVPRMSVLKVYNGMNWGDWGQVEQCPFWTYAAGFSLKVEGENGLFGDNTALNGIRLHCVNPSKASSGPYQDYTTVQSNVGSWGEWSDIKWCPSGFLKSFQLRVESYQDIFDDQTAANNIRFRCSDGSVLQGDGTYWGDWGDWSETCETGGGICGIKTQIEEPQGFFLDDTALNDVEMYCCSSFQV